MMPQAAAALAFPTPDDWIVSLWTKSGALSRWRVTPGTVDDATALERAMRAARFRPDQIADVTIVRASQHRPSNGIAQEDVEQEFRRLLQRARGVQ